MACALQDPADLARVAAFDVYPPPASVHWQAHRLAKLAELSLPEDPVEAERLAEAALAAGPDMLLPLGLLATARIAREDRAGLSEIADRIDILPGAHGWATLVRVAACALDDEPLEAAGHLRTIAETSRRNADIAIRAASIWLMIGQPREAERILDELLADHPDRIDARLARSAANRDRPARAADDLRAVLQLDPANPIALGALSALLNQSTASNNR